jgi:hypothetical protein
VPSECICFTREVCSTRITRYTCSCELSSSMVHIVRVHPARKGPEYLLDAEASRGLLGADNTLERVVPLMGFPSGTIRSGFNKDRQVGYCFVSTSADGIVSSTHRTAG